MKKQPETQVKAQGCMKITEVIKKRFYHHYYNELTFPNFTISQWKLNITQFFLCIYCTLKSKFKTNVFLLKFKQFHNSNNKHYK